MHTAHCTSLHPFIGYFFLFFVAISSHPFHTCQTETDFNSNVQNGIVLNYMNTDMCCWNALTFTNKRMNDRERKKCPKSASVCISLRTYTIKIILHLIFSSFFIGPSSFAEWWCFSFLWSEYYEKYNRQRHKIERGKNTRRVIKSNARETKMQKETKNTQEEH